RQSCRKGHIFVVLAYKKHFFLGFQPKHTGAAVCDMFRGFSGFIQADAHAIYDALFRGKAVDNPAEAPLEVACWAHARRRFWEAAVSGYSVGKEGLLRIRKLYQLDESWKKLPPSAREKKRQAIIKPSSNLTTTESSAGYTHSICSSRTTAVWCERLWATRYGRNRRSGAFSKTGVCAWTTRPLNARSSPSPQVEKIGCS